MKHKSRQERKEDAELLLRQQREGCWKNYNGFNLKNVKHISIVGSYNSCKK